MTTSEDQPGELRNITVSHDPGREGERPLYERLREVEAAHTVYAVLHWIDHEDCEVESVWTTRERAVERARQLEPLDIEAYPNSEGYHNISIYECGLDPLL